MNGHSECDQDELIVWPWVGVIVNLPTQYKEGRFVGESGSKLRDELRAKGFNPKRVNPLWNGRGHSGTALVEFHKDWQGLINGLAFERHYELNLQGKQHWRKNGEKCGLFGWLAREDDYNSSGIVGIQLQKFGNLKTISQLAEEESRRSNMLVSTLTSAIKEKEKTLIEMEDKCNEKARSMNLLAEEKDRLNRTYNDEMKKMQETTREHFQNVFNEHYKVSLQMESEKKELDLQAQELKKREAHDENERKKLMEELQKNAERNKSLEHAATEQLKADENVMKLAAEQQEEKEELHKRILQLQNQLEAKQALELEIEQLRGKINVTKHVGEGEDCEAITKMNEMLQELQEKEEDLEGVEALNQTLVVKERLTNEELQDARKALIDNLKGMSNHGNIGVKRMGELDTSVFQTACKRKYPPEIVKEKAAELCSIWEEHISDPNWHPFKMIEIEGQHKRIIDENDEKLRGLKQEVGAKAYAAVATALTEMNEYNASGSYVVLELWNKKEKRKAALQEGCSFILNKWKRAKRKR